MLMEILEKERDCSFEVLVRHPLGCICFLIDILNCGASVDGAKAILSESQLSDESKKLLDNSQLMSLLSRQHSQIKDVKTVTTILCALIFHRIPRDIMSLVNSQDCA
jgi:hypothetical protein